MDIKSLIDPEGGLIDRRIFADREVYDLERERLFARCWLYLGHNAKFPIPVISSCVIWEKSRSSFAVM